MIFSLATVLALSMYASGVRPWPERIWDSEKRYNYEPCPEDKVSLVGLMGAVLALAIWLVKLDVTVEFTKSSGLYFLRLRLVRPRRWING